jgi:urate oxidase
MADEATLSLHQHGKSRVRLGRVWREGDVHHFVEWMVHTMLESDMEHAFIDGDNTGMTATDTQKNTVRNAFLPMHQASMALPELCSSLQVYVVAKRMSKRCTIEQYAIALSQHFVHTYPRVCGPHRALMAAVTRCLTPCTHCMQVSKAKVWVEQAPWKRVQIGGISHQHGGCAAVDASLARSRAAEQCTLPPLPSTRCSWILWHNSPLLP